MPVIYKTNMTNLEQIKSYKFPAKAIDEHKTFQLSYTFFTSNSKSGRLEHNHNKNYLLKDDLVKDIKEMFKRIGKIIQSGDNVTGNYQATAFYYYMVQDKKISNSESMIRNAIKSGNQMFS